MSNCCKYKVIIGYGRVRVEALKEDNTTVKESVADLPLVSTILAYDNDKEEIYLTPTHGEFFLLRSGAVHAVVDPSGIAIAGTSTHAGLLAYMQAIQNAENEPGLSVNLANADPTVVAFAANIDDLALPTSGYTGLKLNCTVAGVDISGIAAPTEPAQRVIFLMNVGTEEGDLLHEGAGSVAANRFALKGGSTQDLELNIVVVLWYDASISRWKIVNNL